MASAELGRHVEKVAGYPPLPEMGDLQRREFHEALLDADTFEDLRRCGAARRGSMTYLRSTFASNALAAGVSVFELARVMGTSVAMIERHYGTLIEGAGADIARRLTAFEAAQERATPEGAEGV